MNKASVPERRGRKPRQAADATPAFEDDQAMPPQDEAQERASEEDRVAESMAPMAGEPPVADFADADFEDDAPGNDLAGNEASSNEAPDPEPVESTGAGDMSLPVANAPKAAASWDRATGTVQLDWPEIERTAKQDGPNQVMAKLLVAARDEGARSRWPFMEG